MLFQAVLTTAGPHTLDVSRAPCAVLSENPPQSPGICPGPSIPPTISVSSPLMEQFPPNDNLEQLFRVFPHTHFFSSKATVFFTNLAFALFPIRASSLYNCTDLHDRIVSGCPSSPSVLTYIHRCPPHLPDGIEGQGRKNNWNNPLDLLCALFNIHLEAMDNFGHSPDHALWISSHHIS